MAFFASISSSASKFALTTAVLAVLLTGGGSVHARGWFDGREAFSAQEGSIALARLPDAAQQTYRAIFRGGPWRHDKDGSVFGNREHLLPRARRGHYREYTVDTPGARDRGARRIVCGGEPVAPQACWYTADHYASFRRIEP